VALLPTNGKLNPVNGGKGNETDIIRIGQFHVNVDQVSKADIKSMRTFWPMEEYRLLKNRKSARLGRTKRRVEKINAKNAC
jgi:hypothetical protein